MYLIPEAVAAKVDSIVEIGWKSECPAVEWDLDILKAVSIVVEVVVVDKRDIPVTPVPPSLPHCAGTRGISSSSGIR